MVIIIHILLLLYIYYYYHTHILYTGVNHIKSECILFRYYYYISIDWTIAWDYQLLLCTSYQGLYIIM